MPTPYILTQTLRRVGLIDAAKTNFLFSAWYDRSSQKYIEPTGIFHFVAGLGLQTSKALKKQGTLTICDVRAEHVDIQEEILANEYDYLGLNYQSQPSALRERLLEECHTSDFMILPSRYVQETYAAKAIPSTKMFVVPYGVDVSRFKGVNAPDLVLESNGQNLFRIIFVGNVIPLKGLHYLLDAFQKLAVRNSELLIVGSIDPAYKAVLDRGFSQTNVRFLGRIPQIDLWRYYKQSSVFVLPSLSDSFGLVVVEAMAAGLPVIVSDHTGAKEMVSESESGFVVPVRNALALQERLQWLYDHPVECKLMGQKAIQVANDLTWSRYGERLLSVYDQLWTQ